MKISHLVTWIFIFPFIIIVGCNQESGTIPVTFKVDLSKSVGKNTGFWKAIGYDFLFKIVNEPEGQEFLGRAQKNHSVTYFRTHYTFNNQSGADKKAGGSVCGKVVTIDDQGITHYDFSTVNKTFREYVKRGMKPIVEFDFYPDDFAAKGKSLNDESFESNEGLPANWEKWQELLNKFMQNLISEFGIQELKTWYFEVWNEPDSWSRNMLPDFFRLYDVFSSTVKSFNPDFKVGGPACYNLYFMKEFLDHVVYGTNAVTGRKGAPIDFVSMHIYGLSGSWLNPAPEINPLVSKFSSDMLWWQRLMKKYPELKDVEIHLNEWGLCSHGDSKFVAQFPQLEYRNSEFSALFFVKLVDCLYAISDNYNFKTDLLLYWGAWYNAATGPIFMGSRDLMTSGCIPKPILTAYEMLALIGNKRIEVIGPKPGGQYGLIATKSGEDYQLLVYNFNEMESDFSKKTHVQMLLKNLPISEKQVGISEYWLSRNQHNTYRKWEKMGNPQPTPQVINELKEIAELVPDKRYERTFRNNSLKIDIDMPSHSMCLITLTGRN